MKNPRDKNILNTMISVTGVIILAKVLGFIKQIITANEFGATVETDIIMLAEGLVFNVDYLLIQSLSTAFVPIYLYALQKNEGKKFASNIFIAFFYIAAAIAAVLFIGSPIVAKVLAPTYSKDLSSNLSMYIKLLSPVLIIIVEIAIFNSLLKANRIFIPGEMLGFNQNLILILIIFLFGDRIGPDALVIGCYVYAFFNLIFLIRYSRGYWQIRKMEFSDPNLKRCFKMMGPLLLGHSLVFVNQQVDKIIVSGYESGTLTAMNYASSLSNFVATFISSICGVLFTYITQGVVEGNEEAAATLTISSMLQMITIFLPISTIIILNSSDIVFTVFGQGKFDSNAVNSCSIALTGYAFMFVPFVLRELYSRFQYSYNDSKTPMVNSTIAMVVNIILSVSLSKAIGVLGVTLATSISVAVCGILNYLASRKRNIHIKLSGIKWIVVRWLIGIGLCLLCSYIGKSLFENFSSAIRLVIIALLSALAYLAVTFSLIKPLFAKFLRKQ